MAQENRTDFQSTVDSNIYANNNKEIDSTKHRTVLENVKDSFFNLIDDELAALKYNSTYTLQDYLATLLGQLIQDVTIGDFSMTGDQLNVNVDDSDNIISNVDAFDLGGQDLKLVVTFNPSFSVTGKRIVPVLRTTQSFDQGINDHNDLTFPVIREDSGTQITIGLRAMSNESSTNYYLQLLFM